MLSYELAVFDFTRGNERSMEKLSRSLEDYLEAIVMLGGTTEQSVRPSDATQARAPLHCSSGARREWVSFLSFNKEVQII